MLSISQIVQRVISVQELDRVVSRHRSALGLPLLFQTPLGASLLPMWHGGLHACLAIDAGCLHRVAGVVEREAQRV